MQRNWGCSAASLLVVTGQWMLEWSGSVQRDPRSEQVLPSCSLPKSALVELLWLSVHFIWTLASSCFLYHILCLISDGALCCHTALCCTGPSDQSYWIRLSLWHRLLLSFSLLFSEQWTLIPIKLSGTWCEMKYGIHSISAWNDGMHFQCCIFLLWDKADLEICLEIEFIYYNYYWSISFGWHPNKNFFIVKQCVWVVGCLYSKGSARPG